jgi:hypothetical protein
MFSKGFRKIAATVVTMSPEEYYEHVGGKDKFVGALAGNIAGAAVGLAKAKKGSKGTAAVAGALAGTALGGLAGYAGGKVLRGYQANRVHRMAGELNLKATPTRRSYSSEEQ